MAYHSRSHGSSRRGDDSYDSGYYRNDGRRSKYDDEYRDEHSYGRGESRRGSHYKSDSHDNYGHSSSRGYDRSDYGRSSRGDGRSNYRQSSEYDSYDHRPPTRDHGRDNYRSYDRDDRHRSRYEYQEEPSRGRRSRRSDDRYDYYDDERSRPRQSHHSPGYDDYSPPRRGDAGMGRGGPGGKTKNVELWQTAAKTALQAGAQAAFRLRNNKGDWVGEKGIQVGAAALSAGMRDVFSKPGGPSLGGLGGNDGLSASIRQSLFHEAATKALRKLAPGQGH